MFKWRTLRYVLETGMFCLFLAIMRLLPVDAASALGGWIGGLIGRVAKQTRTADRNLRLAFPEKTARERKRIIRGMWNHLGRTAAEFAHLPTNRLFRRVEIEGLENLPDDDQQALFFSGHIGNWELLSRVAEENDHSLALIYRHANNPLVNRIITSIRSIHCTQLIAKGHRSASQLVRALKGGSSIAMLIDQKMNNGIPVPFFGYPAMTAPAIAQMAMRFELPIIPARVMRTKGAYFASTIYPPLVVEKTGDEKQDSYSTMCAINAMLEGWIRESPEQWFWVHRRWPKNVSPA